MYKTQLFLHISTDESIAAHLASVASSTTEVETCVLKFQCFLHIPPPIKALLLNIGRTIVGDGTFSRRFSTKFEVDP